MLRALSLGGTTRTDLLDFLVVFSSVGSHSTNMHACKQEIGVWLLSFGIFCLILDYIYTVGLGCLLHTMCYFFCLYVQFLPATEISYQFENVSSLECFHFGGVAWWIVFATPFDSNSIFWSIFAFLLSISCWAEFNCLIMFRFKIVSFRDV